MSDNWILIGPKLPRRLPSTDKVNVALEHLERAMPDAEEIQIVQSEHVQFFDCGTTMSSDYDEQTGFQLNEYPLPSQKSQSRISAFLHVRSIAQ